MKIKKHLLAPSGVNVHDILEVSKLILDNQFHPKWNSPKQVIHSLPEIRYDTEQLPSTHNVAVDKLKELLDYNTRVTLHLFSQEAASYPSLSIICVHFVSVLEREFSATYLYSNQHSVTHSAKSGPDPRSDSCVVLLDSHSIPRFLYEAKTVTQHTVMQLADKDVIEVLLQGYYCIRYNNINKMVICLTDLVDWHYMLIEASNEKIAIKGYKVIHGMSSHLPQMEYSKRDLQEHTKFIIEMERELRV